MNAKSVLSGLIAIGAALCAASGVPDKSGAKEMERKIKVVGIGNEIEALYSNPVQWRRFLAGISKADSAWISIGLLLRDSADAAATESINRAIGESLERDPSVIFSQIDSLGQTFEICGGPDVYDPKYGRYELAMSAMDRRLKKVTALKRVDLQPIGEKCAAELENSKKAIRKFFRK